MTPPDDRQRLRDAERSIRDLMGLLALPSLWAEKDNDVILDIMGEAVARIVPLSFSCARFEHTNGETAFQIHVHGTPVDESRRAGWIEASQDWPAGASNMRALPLETPAGELRVICFRLDQSRCGAMVYFGSAEADFPTMSQLAVLHAATSLAATGMQAAHARHERMEASRAKDEFLAMLGHELRNPLAPISAAAASLRYGKLDPDQLRRTSEIITRQVKNMSQLINDLLDVSRVTSGLVSIERREIEVGKVIADAVEQAMPVIQAHGHRFEMDLPAEPGHILGDQTRLVQSIVNLLINSAKYTPDGGTIALGVILRDRDLTISVRDDGIGIDPVLLPKVFDLFTQAERTPDRMQGGLGLGLALVKTLVELHGGSVNARSAGHGKGSEFSIVLPRLIMDGDAMPGLSEAPLPAPEKSAALRLLVIDDNADAAEMLATMLAGFDFDTDFESSPTRALERVNVESFDVCLIDIGMPVLDGNALCRLIRANPLTSKIVLIAITGYGQERDRNESMLSGFDYHLVKPVAVEELMELLAGLRRA